MMHYTQIKVKKYWWQVKYPYEQHGITLYKTPRLMEKSFAQLVQNKIDTWCSKQNNKSTSKRVPKRVSESQ